MPRTYASNGRVGASPELSCWTAGRVSDSDAVDVADTIDEINSLPIMPLGLVSSDIGAETVALAAVHAPCETVDGSVDSEMPSSTDSEFASRVEDAGDLDANTPLSLALFKIGVLCADERACVEAVGEMLEPWVMQDDVVLGLVRSRRADPAPW